MANLQVTYLGLNLKNPLVVGASNLTDNVESIKALAKAGAGAIVLKSLFEEQIKIDMAKVNKPYDPIHQHVESNDYQLFYETQHEVEQYLKLITQAKEAVDIPIIASINCSTADNWTSFAHKIESAGADALELNVFILPSDPKKSAEEIRKTYFDITPLKVNSLRQSGKEKRFRGVKGKQVDFKKFYVWLPNGAKIKGLEV
jgi:dihydroorotate dehydrogenase (fumarate)